MRQDFNISQILLYVVIYVIGKSFPGFSCVVFLCTEIILVVLSLTWKRSIDSILLNNLTI